MYRAEIWSGTPHETLHGSDRFLPINAVHEERRKCCRPSGITDATCFFVEGYKRTNSASQRACFLRSYIYDQSPCRFYFIRFDLTCVERRPYGDKRGDSNYLPICFFYYLTKLIIFTRSSRIPCIFLRGIKGHLFKRKNFYPFVTARCL